MCRFRLLPNPEQAAVLAERCRHARFVWNLAVEQQRHWQPGRSAPGHHEQCAQLTAARAEYDWLKAGSQTVQQLGVPPACGRALRDFAQAMHNFFQCVACSAGPCHADVNAARNIAAGRAVTARGDLGTRQSANREPQLCPPAA
ncbi:MAG: helix-turn-helix domain-containing protein [Mycobacterium sp.]|uniref:helix-turn-helix domain-containing protein n=1 Tax=Mycobacterium sp. TaxID=1785 RepID=UPI003F9EB012